MTAAAVPLAPEYAAMRIVRECCTAYDVSCADRAPIHHAILAGKSARWFRADALRVIAETTDWRNFGTSPSGPHGDLLTVLAAIVPTPDWTATGEAGAAVRGGWAACCRIARDAELRQDEDPAWHGLRPSEFGAWRAQMAAEDRDELAKACAELAGMAADR